MASTERALDVAKKCLLPPLVTPIGAQYIGPEHFVDFRSCLKDNLTLLLNLFHAYESDFMAPSPETLDLRIHVALVLCEQRPPTAFRVTSKQLQAALLSLSSRIWPILIEDEALVNSTLEILGSQIRNDEWKTHLGATYAFAEFCSVCFGRKKLDDDRGRLLLAVGLNFLDYFEPEIQLLGLRLFNVLLNKMNKTLAKILNIHEVILKEALQVTTKSSNSEFVETLWLCLFSCMTLNEALNTSQWSTFDTLFETLMTRLAFESDKNVSIIYLSWINKFLSPSKIETFDLSCVREAVRNALGSERHEVLEDWLSRSASDEPNFRCFRWVKKLLLLIQNESLKLGGDKEVLLVQLNLLHACFCGTIGTIPANIIASAVLGAFLEKIITTLAEVVQLYKETQIVIEAVLCFLKSFLIFLRRDAGGDTLLLKNLLSSEKELDKVTENSLEALGESLEAFMGIIKTKYL